MRPREFDLTIAETVRIGNRDMVVLDAPARLVATIAPGHQLLVRQRRTDQTDPLLRLAYPVVGTDLPRDRIVAISPGGKCRAWIETASIGAEINVIAPVGAAMMISANSRRFLIVADSELIWRTVAFARTATGKSLDVVIAFVDARPDDMAEIKPHLPLSAELVSLAMENLDSLKPLVGWADSVIVSVAPETMPDLVPTILRARTGTRPSFHNLIERSLACGIGLCRSCAYSTATGPRLACLDGDLYALETPRQ